MTGFGGSLTKVFVKRMNDIFQAASASTRAEIT